MNKNKMLNFLIVGPQKTGTTWIYEYLRKSKKVCLPKGVKETFFWDRYYSKGINWYLWHFKKCHDKMIIGEIAPTYFSNTEVPKRVFQHFSKIKIIITLRNPYERSWSLYIHQLRYGIVQGSFNEAIMQDFSIIDSSLYADHIKRWLTYFNKDQILILFYENFKENPELFIKKIFEFLDIDYVKLPELFNKKVNKMELSRHHMLAMFANNLAHKLREYRQYWIIEMAKKIGLKKLIFSGNKSLPIPCNNDLDIMDKYFKNNLQLLEKLLSIKIYFFTREYYERQFIQ